VAVGKELSNRIKGAEILFVTGSRNIESRVLSKTGFRQEFITVEGIKGRGWKALRAFLKLPYGLIQSFQIIKRSSPHLVLGVGGYSSGPVVLAAWLMKIPTAIHEQNSYPGFANRVLCRIADRVFISFDDSRKIFPSGSILLTGNPVRKEFLEKRGPGKRDGEKFTILVTGGSQGARAINRAIVKALEILKQEGKEPRVIHHTGQEDYERVMGEYRDKGLTGDITPFIEDMPKACDKADIFIGRAGAGTVFELAALGKPSILIPYPNSPNRHQESNAMALASVGGAEIVYQDKLAEGRALADLLIRYMEDRPSLVKMGKRAGTIAKPDAAGIIADELCGMMKVNVHNRSFSQQGL
jgi:UDP-N-acetylglucosamine--N-acetylmuramyl-(pentapeptide) pyrophosphoryl-undecaprenol N-acetylglucosamine transferase